jgi:8-oxo-dGTP pyrophosphatase MutT (NUDIX family)
MPSSHDGASVLYPVSVKGIVLRDDRVVLVKNPRAEWELPGGKLELDETPEGCVVREIAEELGLAVTVGAIVDAWVYRIAPGRDVMIVTYGCAAAEWPATLASPEGAEIRLAALDELDALPLPAGYRASIRRWAARA